MKMNPAGRLALVVWLAGAAGACAGLQAGSAPTRPALEAPAPPPRTVEPLQEPEPEAQGVETPEPVVVTTPRPALRPSRPSAPKHPTERETPPVTPPPVPTEGPPKAEAAPPGAGLQTTTNPSEADRRVRGLLAKAVKDLDQLDARKLSAGARSQYESARRFVAQSEDALKAGNLVFAEQLADKAAALAAGLLGK
jgi:hypothetical protein